MMIGVIVLKVKMPEVKEIESIESSETIRVFAPEKVTNSISELATKHDMILEKDRVYLSPFHYKKHKKYLEYKQKQALQNDDTLKLG